MDNPFAPIIDKILDVEGRVFTNDPHDAGGPTKFGVTAEALGTARHLGRNATAAEVEALTEPEARQIYQQRYIDGPGFGRVYLLAPAVAVELIDTGVNMGVGTPTPWLQRGLNALNQGGGDYADVVVDGAVGPATIQALKLLIARRGLQDAQSTLLKVLNGFQAVAYVELCESHPGDERYAFGWLKNRVGI